ncbi:MAG: HlyD family type I secretion periplasmic adaptor subunit [Rhodobacteraceae bacterium]|jgi:membrane fusion protein, adhesin transport system|nr:HlyD family type I secretion periplasmic adaptor subunit [Paracoccaceae bacterium]
MSDVSFKSLSREMAGRSSWGSSLIIVIVLALVVSLAVWSNYAELDNVTRGEGRIISSMQNQSVQAGEGGTILRRYVSENSSVAKGELLFEIDPIDATSELNQMVQRYTGLEIRELRLRAEIAREAQFTVPQMLESKMLTVALSEESLFAARRLELQGQVSVLEQRLARVEQDVIAGEVSMESAGRTMELLEEEIAVVEPLVKEKIAPATRLLGLQRELEQARGKRASAGVSIDQAILAIEETRREIDNARDAYGLAALDELAQVVTQKSELSEALPRLEDRVARTLIRAPMDGVVNTLNFRTPGGYVRTGDVVLELVPTGEALVVEGKIKPQDISRIKTGDEVRIRLSAYDSSKYGHVLGRVERISADVVVDERNGTASHYLIDVAIEGEMVVDGDTVELMPGMTASVDVLSGKRTVFEYFWQPIAKVNELALRD